MKRNWLYRMLLSYLPASIRYTCTGSGLFVAAEYRNKGIGRKLQDHAARAAKELGYEDLYLFTNHKLCI